MNALTALIREAKELAVSIAVSSECGRGMSRYIRLRNGGTIWYTAQRGKRGGVKVTKNQAAGWKLDHPAAFGEASY